MREFLFGAVPGSILFYRYAPNLEPAKVIGLILMEVIPYVLVCLVLKINLWHVVAGFLLIYSVYEIGYLINDKVSIKKETTGITEREQFANFNLFKFLLIRIPMSGFIVVLSNGLVGINIEHTLSMLAVLSLVFYAHNRLTNSEHRVATFVALNSLKIFIRLTIISPTAIIYFISSIPHLIIKVIHYLSSKKILSISDANMQYIKPPIYLGFIVVTLFFDYKLTIISLPFFFNHCKSNIIHLLVRTVN